MAESFQALLVLPDEYKLHGGNYFAWKFRVKNILVLRNSWSIVDGEEQRPDGDGDGDKQKAYDDRNREALAIIALSVSDNVIPHVQCAKTSKEAWDALKSLYETPNKVKIPYLRRQLYNLKMVEGDSVIDHLTKFKSIRAQLIDLGEEIEDGEISYLTLQSLPPSFHDFAEVMFGLWSEDNPFRFDKLGESILREEMRKKLRDEERGNTKHEGSKKGNPKPSDKGKCFYCGKPGHLEKNCWKRRSDFSQSETDEFFAF